MTNAVILVEGKELHVVKEVRMGLYPIAKLKMAKIPLNTIPAFINCSNKLLPLTSVLCYLVADGSLSCIQSNVYWPFHRSKHKCC